MKTKQPIKKREGKPPRSKPATAARREHKHDAPTFIEPMQCLAVTDLPEGDGWSYEIKFDGYRCLACKAGSKVTLFSRNEKSLNDRFPALVEALTAMPGDFAVDGEIVALDETGRPSFQLLQNSSSEQPPIHFYLFDMVNRDGQSLLDMPIEMRRRELFEWLGAPVDVLRFAPLLQGDADKALAVVTELGLEGVVGKRNGSSYEPGQRSGAWIKRRINNEQEFVIGGYTVGGRGFESLIVGVYEKKKLQFVARVKNGFVPRLRDEISALFKKHATSVCPFANLPETKASRWGQPLDAAKMEECRWLKPVLVCQIGFTEWTGGGKLRHSTFIAMRDDKKAQTVVRET
ncbi:MAG: ATP-dependent ligase [Prosthecobacter sp.]|nr:ATP-dependent ligase [Prosthecobacter sp.]